MEQVWKFPLGIVDEQVIPMPKGAEILSVQVQSDDPVMWVKVDPTAMEVNRRFIIRGTGHHLPDNVGTFLGTFQIAGGGLVFHVFEGV